MNPKKVSPRHCCARCGNETMEPTGGHYQFRDDPHPVDALEYYDWVCTFIHPVTGPCGQQVGRKKDGSASRDPRYTEAIT